MSYKRHIISETSTISAALTILDELAQDALLFTVGDDNKLTGSVTDGDIRRGLMKGYSLNSQLKEISFKNTKSINRDSIKIEELIALRNANMRIVPILDSENKIQDVINFRIQHSILPLEVIIMAGGKGERLRPLTEKTPKPLLKIGEKPILEHNLRRFEKFGVHSIHISTNYLSEKIEEYVKNNANSFTTDISILKENSFMGTIGALALKENYSMDTILVSNSDLLTDVDYEDFYLDFIKSNADMSVLSIPYHVDIPYAIMNIKEGFLSEFHEKPRYTYFSNGGIYLLKRELIDLIPKGEPFSATDLMQSVIDHKKEIRTYAHEGYWLDIGRHEDYHQAQKDIKNLQF